MFLAKSWEWTTKLDETETNDFIKYFAFFSVVSNLLLSSTALLVIRGLRFLR